MDHHVHDGITSGLRRRGIDVLTAFEDRGNRLPDPALLDRATALGRVLVSQDVDLLVETAQRQRTGGTFAGLIYGHPLNATVGQFVDELELICSVYELEEARDQVIYVPL